MCVSICVCECECKCGKKTQLLLTCSSIPPFQVHVDSGLVTTRILLPQHKLELKDKGVSNERKEHKKKAIFSRRITKLVTANAQTSSSCGRNLIKSVALMYNLSVAEYGTREANDRFSMVDKPHGKIN